MADADPNFLDNAQSLPEDQTIAAGFLASREAEVTRELYGGYQRGESDFVYGCGGYAQQIQCYENKDQITDFTITQKQEPHKINFQGAWIIGLESPIQGRLIYLYEDYLALFYSATLVNAVLTSSSG